MGKSEKKPYSAIHFSRAHLFIVVECKVIIISFMQSSTKVVNVNNGRPAEYWSSLGDGGGGKGNLLFIIYYDS